MTLPLGARIKRDQAPPGRTSIPAEIVVKPRGPHQRARCSGSVHILKTSRRGALKTRVMTNSRPAAGAAASAVAVTLPFRALQLAEIVVEAIKAVVPKMPVVLEPLGSVLERPGGNPAGPPLGLAAAPDQPGALQHLQVLRDRGKAHCEGFGELADRGLARGEACEDRAPRRVGERRVGNAEVIEQHAIGTVRLSNRTVKCTCQPQVSR